MAFTSNWTGGYDTLAAVVTFSDTVALTAAERKPVICATASAASKKLQLDLGDGEVAIVINVGGTNAFTAINLEGDTGTSIAAGKVALIVGSSTANGSKIYVLN